MQTIRDIRKNDDITPIPNGFTENGWANILSHELTLLFHAMCYVVTKYDSKEAMKQGLAQINGLRGTFSDLDKNLFKSEESYQGYIQKLENHKRFIERSNFTYPKTRDEAIELLTQWGLVLDKGDVWDVPIEPFPDVQEHFTLTDEEKAALNHIKLEAIVHPIFSKLVLFLHEKDENDFSYSKADLKELLQIDDAMLIEVLIKLTPYLKEPIENFLAIPDDEQMEFTVVWERIYEDFLGTANPQALQ
ncbi:DUF6042 family protein [Brevibacillus massiliensis]|jgi:hypothetical protein|uniref:DUF6042 family protein n=1 Tax=Brevibacillus massiliensis TaxID=1118054 RepID=UPI0002F91ADE|nr:DUF6042 family protein [Brevibacillus massiliensis]